VAKLAGLYFILVSHGSMRDAPKQIGEVSPERRTLAPILQENLENLSPSPIDK
jgi:hypothetical protein